MNTVSKDLAIKLLDAGYPLEGEYFYFNHFSDEWIKRVKANVTHLLEVKEYRKFVVASPTADEILDLLPKERYYTCIKTNTDRWRIAEFDEDGLAEEGKTSFIAESLADACALMYIFLKEQSLISQKEKMQ